MIFKKENTKVSLFSYHLSRLLSYSAVVLTLTIIGSLTIKNMIWDRFSGFLLWIVISLVSLQIIKSLFALRIQALTSRLADSRFFPVGMGLVTGLLPCGLLIPAYVGASSMPSKTAALFAIFLFFLGTVPALVASQSLIQRLKSKLPISIYRWINPSLGLVFIVVQLIMLRRMS